MPLRPTGLTGGKTKCHFLVYLLFSSSLHWSVRFGIILRSEIWRNENEKWEMKRDFSSSIQLRYLESERGNKILL